MSDQHHNESDAWWIARHENANKVWYGLLALCLFLIVADFGYHSGHAKHGYFDFETMVGFHAVYGFVAFLFVVLTGKELRKILMRSEEYYDVPYVPVVVEHHDHDDHSHSEKVHDDTEPSEHAEETAGGHHD